MGMNQHPHRTSVQVGRQTLVFETGKIARQANGSVWLTAGDTIVFTSACAAQEPSADPSFFPLRVDYQEKFSSAGKTLGGFIKREGRPTERETLVCRLIDRPLRPMFQEGFMNEVQLLSFVYSYDGEFPVEPLAICGASAALVISDIPLIKPVGAVRVGHVDGKLTVNPTNEEQQRSKLDLILAGTEDAILMIEGSCDFLTEEEVLEAIELGHKSIQDICHTLLAWQKEIGKAKMTPHLFLTPSELKEEMQKLVEEKLKPVLKIKEKQARESSIGAIHKEVHDHFAGNDKYSKQLINMTFEELQSKILRKQALTDKVRADGRALDEIRPITIDQSILPRTHGSSLFTRGETQALAVCTLGGENMAQRYEDLHGDGYRHFYLQYFFPPFSVGEVGKVGAPGRREVGHGKLAERALLAIVPKRESFPYTIRLESNIMESNGSSSMATVCGGCLALMDAGVPIERPVAGIAMGLILEKDGFAILSDILGIEDALGDMDFKITGDDKGITAFQMDIKVEGITPDIMKAALIQAKKGRTHILKKMLEVCPKPKEEMSVYAPKIATIQVKPSKIGTIIGPGGKQIRAIVEETGAQVDIDDHGLVSVSGATKESIEKALAMIYELTAEVEIGQIYQGTVVSIVPFGLFVEVIPGKEGLCHISEYDNQRIQKLEDFVKVGDVIPVKVLDINDRGQVKLSRKATLTNTHA